MNIGVNSMPTTYKGWATGYKALIDTAYKKGIDYRKGIFYTDTTENFEDRLVEIGNVEDLTRWDDGDSAQLSDIREGYAKTFTQVRYGRKVAIGQIAEKFQGKDVKLTSRASKLIGTRGYQLEQLAAFSLFGYGFADTNAFLTGVNGTSTSALLPDGKRLFSTLHPASPDNAETWSNALSDNAVVGEAALNSMILNLHNQIDDRGNKLHLGREGYTWLVPIDQFAAASRVVGSEKRSGTGDNDLNAYKGSFDGRPIEVRMIPWLSEWSSTAHFLMANESVEDYMNLCVLTSMPFYIDDYKDDDTAVAYVRGRSMFSVGAVSGRGVVGSQGTGTGTYSS
jgi:hypothetical protein